MKLRWFVECDSDGRKTEPDLQYWNENYNEWQSIPFLECKSKDYELCMHDKDMIGH